MLILEPSVHAVAHTSINHEGLQSWMHDNGFYEDTYPNSPTDPSAPIIQMWDQIKSDGFDRDGEYAIEFAGRHCYKSWKKGRSHDEYIQNIVSSKHNSVLEHATVTFAIAGVSRSLTHQLVRHRAGIAVSQESQRFVKVKPRFIAPPLDIHLGNDLGAFETKCFDGYRNYIRKLEEYAEMKIPRKMAHESARYYLPDATETRLVWTLNYSIMRHIFTVRGAPGADLEIRRLACALLRYMKKKAPNVFREFIIENYNEDCGVPQIVCV